MNGEPIVRNISDTARWVAVYRARETERQDALFRDPFARKLAGKRGEYIAKAFKNLESSYWAWITRTLLFDRFISEQVNEGVNMVINLAAGLDARPYRMNLPSSLRWIEIDLPELLAYKEEILANEKPVCSLERIAVDLADVAERRVVFEKFNHQGSKVLIVSEGLLVYLTEKEVGALAQDLAAQENFQRWVIDIISPGLLRYMQKKVGKQLDEAKAPLKFAPEEGPHFFAKFGWASNEVRSMLTSAAKTNRLPFLFKILSKLPDPKGYRPGKRPWSAVCLLAKS